MPCRDPTSRHLKYSRPHITPCYPVRSLIAFCISHFALPLNPPTMPSLLPLLLLLPSALSLPTTSTTSTSAATIGKIRGVRDPIYHLYLQASTSSPSTPVLGPESSAAEFTIGGTIQSRSTSLYLNVQNATTSYKPLKWESTATTTAWGLEGDTIITVQGSSYGRQLNWLVCKSAEAAYYDLYLQLGSDTPSGRSCSNYQTIHLPCLC
ncbi:hypothetical protein HBI88_125890 [Parastagonospora nodorum]|nr:hypothetical protein HBH89_074390 [Parastagonospora nodorum]KAH4555175.1 hypothetical protein HBH86_105840 [Parastagonospora nodorum]KAH4880647.1 hypothetical protein HBH58_082560 [Parastagonospora nodorum]KAH5702364.1 hypothetical protein HBI44_030420 [Parastagonospora nodorum]KAH5781723.1 hypothetical protein HBI97_105720 [Parastagonospora nodorum]